MRNVPDVGAVTFAGIGIHEGGGEGGEGGGVVAGGSSDGGGGGGERIST